MSDLTGIDFESVLDTSLTQNPESKEALRISTNPEDQVGKNRKAGKGTERNTPPINRKVKTLSNIHSVLTYKPLSATKDEDIRQEDVSYIPAYLGSSLGDTISNDFSPSTRTVYAVHDHTTVEPLRNLCGTQMCKTVRRDRVKPTSLVESGTGRWYSEKNFIDRDTYKFGSVELVRLKDESDLEFSQRIKKSTSVGHGPMFHSSAPITSVKKLAQRAESKLLTLSYVQDSKVTYLNKQGEPIRQGDKKQTIHGIDSSAYTTGCPGSIRLNLVDPNDVLMLQGTPPLVNDTTFASVKLCRPYDVVHDKRDVPVVEGFTAGNIPSGRVNILTNSAISDYLLRFNKPHNDDLTDQGAIDLHANVLMGLIVQAAPTPYSIVTVDGTPKAPVINGRNFTSVLSVVGDIAGGLATVGEVALAVGAIPAVLVGGIPTAAVIGGLTVISAGIAVAVELAEKWKSEKQETVKEITPIEAEMVLDNPEYEQEPGEDNTKVTEETLENTNADEQLPTDGTGGDVSSDKLPMTEVKPMPALTGQGGQSTVTQYGSSEGESPYSLKQPDPRPRTNPSDPVIFGKQFIEMGWLWYLVGFGSKENNPAARRYLFASQMMMLGGSSFRGTALPFLTGSESPNMGASLLANSGGTTYNVAGHVGQVGYNWRHAPQDDVMQDDFMKLLTMTYSPNVEDYGTALRPNQFTRNSRELQGLASMYRNRGTGTAQQGLSVNVLRLLQWLRFKNGCYLGNKGPEEFASVSGVPTWTYDAAGNFDYCCLTVNQMLQVYDGTSTLPGGDPLPLHGDEDSTIRVVPISEKMLEQGGDVLMWYIMSYLDIHTAVDVATRINTYTPFTIEDNYANIETVTSGAYLTATPNDKNYLSGDNTIGDKVNKLVFVTDKAWNTAYTTTVSGLTFTWDPSAMPAAWTNTVDPWNSILGGPNFFDYDEDVIMALHLLLSKCDAFTVTDLLPMLAETTSIFYDSYFENKVKIPTSWNNQWNVLKVKGYHYDGTPGGLGVDSTLPGFITSSNINPALLSGSSPSRNVLTGAVGVSNGYYGTIPTWDSLYDVVSTFGLVLPRSRFAEQWESLRDRVTSILWFTSLIAHGITDIADSACRAINITRFEYVNASGPSPIRPLGDTARSNKNIAKRKVTQLGGGDYTRYLMKYSDIDGTCDVDLTATIGQYDTFLYPRIPIATANSILKSQPMPVAAREGWGSSLNTEVGRVVYPSAVVIDPVHKWLDFRFTKKVYTFAEIAWKLKYLTDWYICDPDGNRSADYRLFWNVNNGVDDSVAKQSECWTGFGVEYIATVSTQKMLASGGYLSYNVNQANSMLRQYLDNIHFDATLKTLCYRWAHTPKLLAMRQYGNLILDLCSDIIDPVIRAGASATGFQNDRLLAGASYDPLSYTGQDINLGEVLPSLNDIFQ
jgi:hypothetical protein